MSCEATLQLQSILKFYVGYHEDTHMSLSFVFYKNKNKLFRDSGVQFSVKPTLLNSKEITIEIYIRNDSDDSMQVERTEGTWFSCNEIKGA